MEKRSDLELVLSRKQSWHADSKVQNDGVLEGEGSAVFSLVCAIICSWKMMKEV